MTSKLSHVESIVSSIEHFTAVFGRVDLRPYQVEAAEAVIRSILARDGETFVWKFARQGGKDETLAALIQYVLVILAHQPISIVAAAPTFRPQVEVSLRRLDARLSQNIALRAEYRRHHNYTFSLRKARALFFSAGPSASVVGQTAWPLLVINEAQDVLPLVYDKRFAPMAAANNATRLFCGTAWTRGTLLAREERFCLLKEQHDGLKRLFIVDGPQIARLHPPYGRFLESEIARLGENHPIVLTQYLCREIDAQSAMFTPARLALMQCDSATAGPATRGQVGGVSNPSPSAAPLGPSAPIAFTLDVAGQSESYPAISASETAADTAYLQADTEGARDSTALTIFQIDLSTLPALHAPTYRVLERRAWTGTPHLTVFGQIKALAEAWRPQHIVIDATGVGEGLWALLDKFFPTRVIPFKFTTQSKSDLGYRFLSIIETGRFRDCSPSTQSPPHGERQVGAFIVTPSSVRLQYSSCTAEVLPGPQKILRWGVPEGTRADDGSLIHDDHLMADALCAELDRLTWSIRTSPIIVHAPDPLDELQSWSRHA